MKKVIFLLVLFTADKIIAQNLPTQAPCATNPVYRQFDFWIGDWEAFNTRGIKAGDSHIERLLDSCVVLENWTSAQMGYKGKSYNTFNAGTGKWEQYWVDNKGGTTHYSDGHAEKNAMIFLTEKQRQQDGSFKIFRLSFYKLSEDKVRQHGESSTDGGTTWKTDYDLEYRRKH